MPRYPGGSYYLPPGTIAAPDTTIESTKYNVFTADVETELNTQITKDAAQDAALASGLASISSSTVSFTPAGDITSTNVQAAIVEVDAEMHAADTALTAADALRVLKAGDTMSGHLTLPTGPAAANAVRKDYVDAADTALSTADALKVLKAGDTMTGHLTLPITPAAANAVRKDYVDAADALKLPLAGGTLTGNLLVNTVISAGQLYSATAGDINAVRTGSPTTGVIFLGNTGHYLYFDGSAYQYGGTGGGTAYHTGNLNPAAYVSNGRLALLGDYNWASVAGVAEPYGGGCVTGGDWNAGNLRFRAMQLLTSGWFTIGYV